MAKTMFQSADGTGGGWKSPGLPGSHSSPCWDVWSQPAVGIRESKQQEPTAAKSGDSSTLQTDVFRLGGRQGGQPNTTDNLSDAVRSLLRAGEASDICTCHSYDGPGMAGMAPHWHPFASRAQPHQLRLVPGKGFILSAFKSNR